MPPTRNRGPRVRRRVSRSSSPRQRRPSIRTSNVHHKKGRSRRVHFDTSALRSKRPTRETSVCASDSKVYGASANSLMAPSTSLKAIRSATAMENLNAPTFSNTNDMGTTLSRLIPELMQNESALPKEKREQKKALEEFLMENISREGNESSEDERRIDNIDDEQQPIEDLSPVKMAHDALNEMDIQSNMEHIPVSSQLQWNLPVSNIVKRKGRKRKNPSPSENGETAARPSTSRSNIAQPRKSRISARKSLTRRQKKSRFLTKTASNSSMDCNTQAIGDCLSEDWNEEMVSRHLVSFDCSGDEEMYNQFPHRAQYMDELLASREDDDTSSLDFLEGISFPVQNIQYMNSISFGKKVFEWLINPLSIYEFFENYWETKASLITRKNPKYYLHLASFREFDQALLRNNIEYGTHIDVTSYTNGVKKVMKVEGRATPPNIWFYYSGGCSIRLLNPHVYFPKLYTLNSILQELFHCLVGSNIYITPPNSQGFAPHYDDIEAFVLQIEGKKRWTLYKPKEDLDALPRFSSKNLTEKDCGEMIFDEVLEAGDLLYFPRGTIHQARTLENTHSFHITLSCYQRQTYADLFEHLLPMLLKKSISKDINMRRGVPIDMWYLSGYAHQSPSERRANLMQTIADLFHKMTSDDALLDTIDSAVDEMAKRFQHEALPPSILPKENNHTIFGSQTVVSKFGDCLCDYKIDINSKVRLLRANIIRLVKEKDENKRKDVFHVYYYVDNSKNYCQYDINYFEVNENEAFNTGVLINTYPHYMSVAELPKLSKRERVDYVMTLWERGILMMEEPFKND